MNLPPSTVSPPLPRTSSPPFPPLSPRQALVRKSDVLLSVPSGHPLHSPPLPLRPAASEALRCLLAAAESDGELRRSKGFQVREEEGTQGGGRHVILRRLKICDMSHSFSSLHGRTAHAPSSANSEGVPGERGGGGGGGRPEVLEQPALQVQSVSPLSPSPSRAPGGGLRSTLFALLGEEGANEGREKGEDMGRRRKGGTRTGTGGEGGWNTYLNCFCRSL